MAILGVGQAELDPLSLLPVTSRPVPRRPSLSNTARFLRRATVRSMTNSSLAVREAAADQLDGRQHHWANSKPVMLLDALWNMSFVAVAVGVLSSSLEEIPSVPLRIWITGYALQCVVHVVSVGLEYWKRRNDVSSGRVLSFDDDERMR